MNKRILLIIVGSFIFCNIFSQELKTAKWLIGVWENKTDRGSIYEEWIKINDNELAGKSYVLKGTDTIVFETMRIVHEQEKVFYIPIVKGENNDLPVYFNSKLITGDKLIFENPEHDFPQVISYTRTGKKSLIAEISGINDGKEERESYPMRKIK
ncbi:MAG: DUF6265 family protein [Bacteroidales bacterium]|jgi:hypothetical protein|nr:DUF6265 family protein [Bacteroidales bacterium]